jgi:hypothetical protein
MSVPIEQKVAVIENRMNNYEDDMKDLKVALKENTAAVDHLTSRLGTVQIEQAENRGASSQNKAWTAAAVGGAGGTMAVVGEIIIKLMHL